MSSEKIIIYPNFAQRISSWCLKDSSGNYSIPLSKSIDYDSIILLHSSEKQSDELEFKLLREKESFQIGDEVSVANKVGGTNVKGRIINIENNYVDIITQNELHRVYDYKHLVTHSKHLQGCLSVDLTNKKGTLKLSYLFGNVGWKSHYMMFINKHEVSLKLVATINTSEKLNGEIILVAGDVPLNNSRELVRAAQSVNRVQEMEFNEYHRYNVGTKCIVDNARVDIFTHLISNNQKYYYHDTNSSNVVTFGYVFNAPKFLPSGDVYIYDNLMYAGNHRMKEYQEGDKTEIKVGKTTKVQIQSHVSDISESEDKDLIEIETNITNHTSSPIVLMLKHYVENRKIISSDVPFVLRDGYVVWELHVPSQKMEGKISLYLAPKPDENQ